MIAYSNSDAYTIVLIYILCIFIKTIRNKTKHLKNLKLFLY